MPRVRVLTPTEFECRQCGRRFCNPRYRRAQSFCSPTCYRTSPTFEAATVSGGQAHKATSHWWGSKISHAKRGVARPDMLGANNWNWKGGFDGRQSDMQTQRYKAWRQAVFERDDFTCRMCGDRNAFGKGKTVRLEAHHVVFWAHASDRERYDVALGMTLCRPCHLVGHQLFPIPRARYKSARAKKKGKK